MSDQTPDANAETAERRGWRAAWQLMVAVLVGLLAACAYWIVSLGFSGAIADTRFQWLAFAAALSGILVLGRFTLRPFTRPFEVDRRNVALMGRRFGNWFVPKSPDDGKR